MDKIKKSEATPLYIQLKNIIKKEIKSGVLKPGEKIPSEAEMKKTYQMSRVTIRNALAELEVEGYITKMQGKGSFVAKTDMLRLPDGVTSFSNDGKMQGIEVSSDVIEQGLAEVVSDLDKEFFSLNDYDKIVVIKRVRKANGAPVMIEENHFPLKMAGLIGDELKDSLYEVLKNKYKITPSIKGRRSIKIGYANEEVAKHLDLSIGTPVIESEMGVLDVNGEPVHTVKDIVRGDVDRFFKWYV